MFCKIVLDLALPSFVYTKLKARFDSCYFTCSVTSIKLRVGLRTSSTRWGWYRNYKRKQKSWGPQSTQVWIATHR